MAGPEVPQHGALNIGYSTGTSVYQPQSVSVPSGAGALWAGVGDTAIKAAGLMNNTVGMMLQSPMNPAVHAQMLEARDRANMGSATMAYNMANPSRRNAIVGETPQGATMTAPATLPVNQATQWDLDQDGDGQNPPPPEKQPVQPEQKKKEGAPPAPSHQQEMGQVSPAGSNLYASSGTGVPAGYQGAGSSDAAQAGTPGSMTFLNPATGNIEARKTDAIQPSGMFAAKAGAPAPAAPSTPAQPPQSQTPAAATMADKASMAQWQANDAQRGLISSQDALAWMKNQTTLAQDATFLPMGGPPGPDGKPSPAFAFHMKGGGINTVPLSQMVQRGAGPVVAANNTSTVLSATDQANGQQPGGMPSGTGAGAPQGSPADQIPAPMPSGTGAGAPQGTPPPSGPPPAPTAPMPSGTGLAAPQGTPGPPPAPGAYNPAPYQQGIAQAMAQPGALIAQEGQQAGTRSTDTNTTAAAPATEAPPQRVQAEARYTQPQTALIPTPPEQVQELNTDADAKTSKRTWQTDNTGKYTTLTSPRGGFYQQRFYRGTPSWQEGLWTPEAVKKQDVLDNYGTSGGVPRGEAGMLDKETIDKMPMSQIDGLLAKAVWWKSHNIAMDQGDQNRLNAESTASQRYQTLIDMAQWAKEHNVNPKDYNNDSILKSFEAANRDGVMTQEEGNKALQGAFYGGMPQNPGQFFTGAPRASGDTGPLNTDWWKLAQYGYHDAFAGYQPQHPFTYAVGSKIQDLTKALSLLPEYGERAISNKEWPTKLFGLDLPEPINIKAGWPVATNPSNIPEINSMVTGGSPDEAISKYTEMKRRIDQQYVKDVQNLAYAGKRVPENDINNMTELSKENGKIKGDNPMREKGTDKLINPYDPSHYASAAASPTPTPTPAPTGTGSFTASRSANASPTPMQTIDTTDSSAVDAFLKAHPEGGQVYNRQGQLRTISPGRN